jgi:hypothetical protein
MKGPVFFILAVRVKPFSGEPASRFLPPAALASRKNKSSSNVLKAKGGSYDSVS